jgi:hypothetical protein
MAVSQENPMSENKSDFQKVMDGEAKEYGNGYTFPIEMTNDELTPFLGRVMDEALMQLGVIPDWKDLIWDGPVMEPDPATRICGWYAFYTLPKGETTTPPRNLMDMSDEEAASYFAEIDAR